MADLSKTCKTLFKALNSRGANLLFNRKEFMGIEGIPHTMYSISKAYFDESIGRYKSREIYKSASLVRIIFYLNDLWCLENGLPLPDSNKEWVEARPEDFMTVYYNEINNEVE